MSEPTKATCPNCGLDYETAGELRAWKDDPEVGRFIPDPSVGDLVRNPEAQGIIASQRATFESENAAAEARIQESSKVGDLVRRLQERAKELLAQRRAINAEVGPDEKLLREAADALLTKDRGVK